jgi:hypothetical protein
MIMHVTQRKPWLGSLMVAALVIGCADGEDGGDGSFSATNLTYYTTAPPVTTVPMMTTTGEPSTSESETNDDATVADTTNDPSDPPSTTSDPNTTAVDPSTTTGPDPSTTAPDPSTTAPDPSTTAPDPSTTEPDPSTTNMTMPMTTDPPDPPGNDNQPTSGLYETCLTGSECDNPTACLMVTDNMTMMVYDGFCTILCNTVANCGQAPDCPAVQKCAPFDVGQSICVLECVATTDCPIGMVCTAVTNPNMTMGNYCI